jgi:hypothetical protein
MTDLLTLSEILHLPPLPNSIQRSFAWVGDFSPYGMTINTTMDSCVLQFNPHDCAVNEANCSLN